MSTPSTLGELDEAQQDAVREARERIEQAEEYVNSYRSQMHRMQENFYEFAAREGVADDPGFRQQLQRVSDQVEENVRGAVQVIDGFEEDVITMTTQHERERERFLHEQGSSGDRSGW